MNIYHVRFAHGVNYVWSNPDQESHPVPNYQEAWITASNNARAVEALKTVYPRATEIVTTKAGPA